MRLPNHRLDSTLIPSSGLTLTQAFSVGIALRLQGSKDRIMDQQDDYVLGRGITDSIRCVFISSLLLQLRLKDNGTTNRSKVGCTAFALEAP